MNAVWWTVSPISRVAHLWCVQYSPSRVLCGRRIRLGARPAADLTPCQRCTHIRQHWGTA